MKTIHETNQIRIFLNSSGEVFIERKLNKISIRISPTHNGLLVTNRGGILQPTKFNGVRGFDCTPINSQ